MDAARECYYTMRELVLRHPGGSSSEASLAALRKLCHIAGKLAADGECNARLAAIEEHATILFSGCGSGNWVRRRMLAELEQFRSRLYVLEVESSSESRQRQEKAA